MNDFDWLAHLPGDERERAWIKERLRTLGVQEGTVLFAAVQKEPPKSAEDAVCCLQSLDNYNVISGVGSYEALGQIYLASQNSTPASILPSVDLAQAGQRYEDEHPGLFVGNCYVEYPRPADESSDTPMLEKQGCTLSQSKSSCIRKTKDSSAKNGDTKLSEHTSPNKTTKKGKDAYER